MKESAQVRELRKELEKENYSLLPHGSRWYNLTNLSSNGLIEGNALRKCEMANLQLLSIYNVTDNNGIVWMKAHFLSIDALESIIKEKSEAIEALAVQEGAQ